MASEAWVHQVALFCSPLFWCLRFLVRTVEFDGSFECGASSTATQLFNSDSTKAPKRKETPNCPWIIVDVVATVETSGPKVSRWLTFVYSTDAPNYSVIDMQLGRYAADHLHLSIMPM